MHKLFSCLLLLLSTQSFSQTEKTFRITSSFTSFPDTARVNGHQYKNVLYPSAEHYSDSTVMIIVPQQLKTKKQVDLVFWFHGWRNNIDSANAYFELVKQFLASHCNAVLVMPETTKDAPDSYGGKLEQKDIFKKLLNDVLYKLKNEKVIGKRTVVDNLVLAGHSGAFRVIAHILQDGGVEVKQTILFDGLYSQVDKFTNWILADSLHQFINIYTDNGGTDEISRKMMLGLRDKNIPFINPEEKEVNASMLRKNKIIFIHSLKEHNDVINRPDHNFRLYLVNSPVLKPVF